MTSPRTCRQRTHKHLCQDDPGALDAIDRATQREAHRPVSNNNVITSSTEKTVQGNANTYALRKLRKDRPDLHERVISEEISPHAAMCAHIKKRSWFV